MEVEQEILSNNFFTCIILIMYIFIQNINNYNQNILYLSILIAKGRISPKYAKHELMLTLKQFLHVLT